MTIIENIAPGGSIELGQGESCIRFQYQDVNGGACDAVITLGALGVLVALRDDLILTALTPQIDAEAVLTASIHPAAVCDE